MFEFESFVIDSPKGDITIRLAEHADCPFILDLYNNLYKGEYPIECCTHASAYVEALDSGDYFWLVAVSDKKVIGSVLFTVNRDCRIAKAVGAAVRPDFQGCSLMKIMAKAGTDYCLSSIKKVDLIYSTARTVHLAPQKVLQDIGYKCIGILPNVVKVKKFETHAIFVKYKDDMWDDYYRYDDGVLTEVAPFYKMVQSEFPLPDLPVENLPSKKRISYSDIPFEFVYNPRHVKEIFEERLSQKGYIDRFFLQQPNLLLYNKDLQCEIFIKWMDTERQANVIWLNYENKNWYSILDSMCNACYNLNIRYFEILIDGWDMKKQKAAIEAKFVPCAYFPGLFMDSDQRKTRRGAVVFVRSFEVLDFTNLHVDGIARDFLIEFYLAWQDVYIGNFFKNLRGDGM